VILVLALDLLVPIVAMGLLRTTAERLWPIDPARGPAEGVNILAFYIWLPIQLAMTPAAMTLGTFLTNRLGGGFIVLPSHGWGLIAGCVAYLLAMELLAYLFHRVQHVSPWLWSMHSLHHSDPTFDSTTAVLHHWIPPLIQAFLISIPLGLVFKVPPVDLAIYSATNYWAYLIHTNVRLDFGRFAWVLNSPSLHRVHHSALSEHHDCNYAAVLPIFDVIFGTYRPPRPGEWPVVGLAQGGHARNFADLVLWPIRRRLREYPRSPQGLAVALQSEGVAAGDRA
jgi:sterol desaturase/sphingolipid hydroxylase (fatty acid hydroxylase superfamily)